MNLESFRNRAEELLAFCCERGYNEKYLLLWDLSLHSGCRRFVVWSVEHDCALHCFVASHGSGSAKSKARSAYASLSNEDGSHLSSEGRALVGERYIGR